MKKILIITYYWPPAGGSGVQRWLKFVKYLTRKNYYCIVYTPDNPEFPVIDNSMLKDIPQKNFEVIKTKIFEPYSIYKFFTGKSKKEKITVSFLSENQNKSSFKEKISQWIRGNLFIPDAKMCWIKPSVSYLSDYIRKNKIDVIISTGPPHSMHLIALGLKNKFPKIRWIADFRDPWTNIDFLNDLYLTKWAQNKHQQLEKKVVQSTDAVISVSPTLAYELSQLSPELKTKFFTITNGFDEEDYYELNNLQHPSTPKDNSIVITYAGLIPSNRNPEVLWKAIQQLSNENLLPQNFTVHLIGKVDISVWENIQKYNVERYIKKTEYLPHSEVLKLETQADALLLIINNAPNSKGILTGKLFEYLALQKPIIAIGPTDGDAAQIIKTTNAGVVIDYNDIESMKNTLLQIIHHKISSPQIKDVMLFSRNHLTEQLIQVIESLK